MAKYRGLVIKNSRDGFYCAVNPSTYIRKNGLALHSTGCGTSNSGYFETSDSVRSAIDVYLGDFTNEEKKTISLEKQLENLLGFMKSMLEYGNTGEDAVDIKGEIEQVLSEAKI